jgi:hypothetical protein
VDDPHDPMKYAICAVRIRLSTIQVEIGLRSCLVQRLADGDIEPPPILRGMTELIPLWRAQQAADLQKRIDALRYEAAMLRLSVPD